MRRMWLFLAACFGLLTSVSAVPPHTDPASTNRVLIIDSCSTTVAGGKATLKIGQLQPNGDTYSGDYSMKVTPYFFKNEKGMLAILIPGESIESASKGLTVNVTGTATENGKNGKVLNIDATATPLDANQGNLKLWFTVDGRKMVFETRYRFADQKDLNPAKKL